MYRYIPRTYIFDTHFTSTIRIRIFSFLHRTSSIVYKQRLKNIKVPSQLGNCLRFISLHPKCYQRCRKKERDGERAETENEGERTLVDKWGFAWKVSMRINETVRPFVRSREHSSHPCACTRMREKRRVLEWRDKRKWSTSKKH